MIDNISDLAPIVFFVYHRPELTKKTLEHLAKNELAQQSHLIIFSDGPKNSEDEKNVKAVRKIINNLKGFARVDVIEHPSNKGLANSVILGVTSVFKDYDKVIVLEDDLIPNLKFLKFMNKALDFYENQDNIFSISGYVPNLDNKKIQLYENDVFLSHRPCSWGWATWKACWDKASWDIDLLKMLNDKKQLKQLNKVGSDLAYLMRFQSEGKIDSWAVRWTATLFLHNAYAIYPLKSYIKSEGFGLNSTHFKKNAEKYLKFVPQGFEELHEAKLSSDLKEDFHISKAFKEVYDFDWKYRLKLFLKRFF